MLATILTLTVLAAVSHTVAAIDNGKGITPPMGWRSWNCFGADVDQNKMEQIMDAQVARWLTVDGVPTSLRDLGYNDCGLDDNWQACGAGVANSFHDATGYPIINTQRFPSMKGMTDYGHARNLTVGWYGNNCICSEHGYPNETAHMIGDVKAHIDFGFDSTKLDGCGEFTNLTWWADLFNKTGKAILIENCHWGGTVPTLDWCPWNYFRTSGDITNTWDSMMKNLQTVTAYQDYYHPLTHPGCWNYPDMLEVGRLATFNEDRAHFGAWCIVSSPLILGFDLRDNATYQRVWPIISNREAIAVNQQWAGHPGMLVKSWNPSSNTSQYYIWGVKCDSSDPSQSGWVYDANSKTIKANNGLCLDGSDNSETTLAPCNGSPAQQFTYQGNHEFTTSGGGCLDVYNFSGPVVQIYSCNGGTNQVFTLGTRGTIQDSDGYCLAFRANSPGGGGGATTLQIWAKPQPQGSMAVLVINSDKPGAAGNHSVTIDFKSLNLTAPAYAVRSIWDHADLGVNRASYTTDVILGHDSRFYLLTPQSW